jgi:outer membrane autotransporter protein
VHERVSFNAEIGWLHIYGQNVPRSDFTFREGSDEFTARGLTMNRDSVVVGLGVGLNISKNVGFSLTYNGEYGGRGQSHGGRAMLEFRW